VTYFEQEQPVIQNDAGASNTHSLSDQMDDVDHSRNRDGGCRNVTSQVSVTYVG